VSEAHGHKRWAWDPPQLDALAQLGAAAQLGALKRGVVLTSSGWSAGRAWPSGG